MVVKVTFGVLREVCLGGGQKVMPREVALAHIDLAARVLGDDWKGASAEPEDLATRFPDDAADGDKRLACFGSLRRFENWQQAIFRLTVAAGGGLNGDPYGVLAVIAESSQSGLDIGDMAASLRHFFPDLDPASITRDRAIEANALLSGNDRTRLRKGLHELDRLRLLPAVRERDLLCMTPIGKLPQRRASGRWEVALPPLLAEFHAGLPVSYGTGLKAIFEAGVAAGHLDAEVDILPAALLEPRLFRQLEIAVRSRHSARLGMAYIARVIHAIRKESPDVPHPNSWSNLRERVRRLRPRMNLNALSHLATRSAGLAPHLLDQAWLDPLLSNENRHSRVVVIQGANLMNKLRLLESGALSDVLPVRPFVLAQSRQEKLALPADLADILATWCARTSASARGKTAMRRALRTFHRCTPNESPLAIAPCALEGILGRATHLAAATRRKYVAVLQTLAEHHDVNPVTRWQLRLDAAKDIGLARQDIHALGAVRCAALRSTPSRGPDEIDPAWAVAVLAGLSASSSRQRFRRGIQLHNSSIHTGADDAVAPSIELLRLTDARPGTKPELQDHHLRDLEAHIAFRGLAANTGRAWRTALRLVIAVATDHGVTVSPLALGSIRFGALLGRLEGDADVNLPAVWPRARLIVLQLERELSFSWTEDWATLQKLVVSAGVEAADNPVPDFAAAASSAGLSPRCVDREWCWQHERTLRPDLQITWSRNVRRWDALCANPEILASCLISPEPLGPMPPRGERAKHGLYPLPRTLEAVLASHHSSDELSRKQLNGSAHFLWRHAREGGLFIRGDEPCAARLLGDEVLQRVLYSGTHGLGPGPLREHMRRLVALRRNIPATANRQ